jgi:hypothetical protein
LLASTQGLSSRIEIAPSQYISGPSAVSALPTRLGSSQSFTSPFAIVHITPKPAASSFFQGSRPKRPNDA